MVSERKGEKRTKNDQGNDRLNRHFSGYMSVNVDI